MISGCGHLRKRLLKDMTLGICAMYLLVSASSWKNRVGYKILVILSNFKICFLLIRSPNAYQNASHIISIQKTSVHQSSNETFKLYRSKYIHFLELKFQNMIALAPQCSVNERKTYQMFMCLCSHSFTWQNRMFNSLFLLYRFIAFLIPLYFIVVSITALCVSSLVFARCRGRSYLRST